MATLLLTGGGTAGHVIPHLALLPYLKNSFDKIVYIGSKNSIEKTIIEKEGIPFFSVPCAKLSRTEKLKNLSMPFKVLAGISRAKKLIREIKPDVIFSKGGYVSVPVVIAGAKLNVPVISHESDLTIGLANKVCAKYCKKVLTTFPETAKEVKNGQYVGPPLKDSLFTINKSNALKSFGFSGQKPVLLVTGGSLGSVSINNAVIGALPELLKTFDVIHVVGKGNLKKMKIRQGYYPTEFLSQMENAFSVADVCVTRAGSNTLFELLALKVPCLAIPLPATASRGDQIVNAEYFQRKGLLEVLPQRALSTKSLTLSISGVYKNRSVLISNLDKTPIISATKKIADVILNYKQI